MESLLKITDLVVCHGRRTALDRITLQVDSNAGIIGVFGPNGAGKTTLFNAVAGQLPISSGTIAVKDNTLPTYLPDRNVIYNFLLIKESIKLFSEYFQDFSAEIAGQVLETLKLDSNLKVSQLSKGMKEQLNLGLMLSRRSSLYLFDEPLAAVDPLTRDTLLNLIETFRPKQAAVLISTHLIYGLEKLFNECMVIYNGRLLLHQPCQELAAEGGLENKVKEVLSNA